MNMSEYKERFVVTQVDHALIDVRDPHEYESGHLVGAVNIPLHELEDRLDEFSPELPVVVYCRTGNRSGRAAELLMRKDYTNVLNAGGLTDLAAQGLPTAP